MRKTKAEVYGTIQDGVLIRKVERNRHFYWKYGGYAFGQSSISGDWNKIRIEETDTGQKWEATREQFQENAQPIATKYGTQYVLRIEYFSQ